MQPPPPAQSSRRADAGRYAELAEERLLLRSEDAAQGPAGGRLLAARAAALALASLALLAAAGGRAGGREAGGPALAPGRRGTLLRAQELGYYPDVQPTYYPDVQPTGDSVTSVFGAYPPPTPDAGRSPWAAAAAVPVLPPAEVPAPILLQTAAPVATTSTLPTTPTPPPLPLPVIPPPQKCSWANEDCHETKCCSNVECDYLFQTCKGYTCYKKDQWDGGFAGCQASQPGDWLGTVLGGPIQPREIAPAPGDVQIQGTSLFCISIVVWNAGPAQGWQDSEGQLAKNWMTKGLGILHCDDHMIVDGVGAPGSGWGSTANIDAFIGYWQKVKEDGRYKKHDWVVKADADAVFFPNRLKMHLQALRTPRGSAVLLLNNAYKFQFLGALEVFTREAMDLYFANADRCASGSGGHSGGEDYYMKNCLIGIGVDIQKDFALLHDKYAAQDGCNDGWVAAFHFYKKVSDWDWCYNEARAAQAAKDNEWNAQHPAAA